MGALVPDSKYFNVPFATSGDKATIPEAVQPSGAISYTQGYGPDYERDPANDPLAKRIPRDETNEFYFQITNSLKYLQLYGVPEFYALADGGPANYPLGARVRRDDKLWVSVISNNTAVPGADGTKWVLDTLPSEFPIDIPIISWGTSPPSSPAIGDRHLVAPSATGAWSGQSGKIATWFGSWNFANPVAGLQVQWWNGRQVVLRYDGAAWAEDLATMTAAGRIEIATSAEALERSRNDVSVTPKALSDFVDGNGFSGNRRLVLTTPGAGNFIVPDNVYAVDVEVWGGGGGGGGAGSNGPPTGASGGGSGAYGRKRIPVTPGQVIPYVVGAGGAAGAVGGGAGGTGGSSTFGTDITCGGGSGAVGSVDGSSSVAGVGGIVSGADFKINGRSGQGGVFLGGAVIAGFGAGTWSVPPTGPNTDVGQTGAYPGGGGSGGAATGTSVSGGGGAPGMISVGY